MRKASARRRKTADQKREVHGHHGAAMGEEGVPEEKRRTASATTTVEGWEGYIVHVHTRNSGVASLSFASGKAVERFFFFLVVVVDVCTEIFFLFFGGVGVGFLSHGDQTIAIEVDMYV